MASPAQHAANNANAAFSTGPRTAEGKTASSANALAHGMTSRKVVLPHEDEAAYNALLECTLDLYNPADELERTLAIRVAETLWRATRSDRYHDAFLAERTKALAADNPETIQDLDQAAVLMFVDPAEQQRFSLMLRYLNTAKREHHKAVAELEKVQKTRYRQQMERAVVESWLQKQDHPEPETAAPNAAPVNTNDDAEVDQTPVTAAMNQPAASAPEANSLLSRQQRRSLERADRKAADRVSPHEQSVPALANAA
jgi:hypothetical protein